MKKVLAFTLALCMILTLAACGGSSTPANNGSSTPANNSGNKTAEPKEPDFGKIDGNAYTNEYLDIKFTLPDGWEFKDADYIANLNSTSKDETGKTTLKEMLTTKSNVYLALGLDPKTGNNVIVSINKITSTQLSEKDYVDQTKATYLEKVKSSPEEYKVAETLKVTFCGQEKTILHIQRVKSGSTVDQYLVLIEVPNSYYGVVTITSMKGADNSIFSAFSKLN